MAKIIESQKMETMMNHLIKSQYLMKATQLLLSVSVFSVLLAHHSPMFASFINSFNFCFSAFFSHNIDKNCIFLVCNGLVVFLAKFSKGLDLSPKTYESDDDGDSDLSDGFVMEETVKQIDENLVEEETFEVVSTNVLVETRIEIESEMVILEEEVEIAISQEERQESVKNVVDDFVVGNQEDEQEENIIDQTKSCLFHIEPEIEYEEEEFDEDEEEIFEEEEEGNGLLSTDELNKKFEDFIRKMKLELRIEAQSQRHLVMV
ncbi:hypothetical protein ACFE04_023795 [Oxalis oulophora]